MKPEDIAQAAGRDAGNRAMRAGGRSSWSVEDYNAAARETNRLLDCLPLPNVSWQSPEVSK